MKKSNKRRLSSRFVKQFSWMTGSWPASIVTVWAYVLRDWLTNRSRLINPPQLNYSRNWQFPVRAAG